MKNFLRALRHVWPYRRRFIVSVCCAALAAILWGLNFSCIHPVLELLTKEKTPRESVDASIAEVQALIDGLLPQTDPLVQETRPQPLFQPSRRQYCWLSRAHVLIPLGTRCGQL